MIMVLGTERISWRVGDVDDVERKDIPIRGWKPADIQAMSYGTTLAAALLSGEIDALVHYDPRVALARRKVRGFHASSLIQPPPIGHSSRDGDLSDHASGRSTTFAAGEDPSLAQCLRCLRQGQEQVAADLLVSRKPPRTRDAMDRARWHRNGFLACTASAGTWQRWKRLSGTLSIEGCTSTALAEVISSGLSAVMSPSAVRRRNLVRIPHDRRRWSFPRRCSWFHSRPRRQVRRWD